MKQSLRRASASSTAVCLPLPVADNLGYRSDSNRRLLSNIRKIRIITTIMPITSGYGHSPNIRNQSPAGCFVTGILRAVAPKQIFFVKNSAYLDSDMQDEYGHRYRCQVLQHYTQYRDLF